MKRQEAAIRGIAAVALAWLLLSLSPLARAQTNPKQVDIDIGEMPLTLALQEFSKQTGLQHLYLPTDKTEEEIVVGPVRGHFTASEILTRLLPAGFTFSWSNDRTVAVLSPSENGPPGGVHPERTATDRQHSELSKEQQLSMVNGGGRSGSARGPYAFDWEVTVEGKRISDSIFDGLDLDIPATVLDRQAIDASGASSVTDLLARVVQQTHTMADTYLGDGTQFADLRGLGFDTTLVLINGRRTIATASALSFNAFDLNSIPLAAVERVEIMSDSTSPIHGADAVGGVFNIVLRDNIPEPRFDIDYAAAAGGAVERHAAFSASGVRGRARGSIVFDYFDRSPLLGQERDRWANQDFRRFGGVDWRSPTSAPGNVYSTTGGALPGLPSSFAAIPLTRGGTALTAQDFATTAGQLRLDSLSRYTSVFYEGTRRGVMAQGEVRITPAITGFGELLYVNRDNRKESEPPALFAALVPATNPHNPFDEDVSVDALLTDLGPRTSGRTDEMLRTVAGLHAQHGDWKVEFSILESQDDDVMLRTNELDPAKIAAALGATDAEEALNLFGGSGANSPQLLKSLLAAPARSRFLTEGTQVTANVRGPLVPLPAGRAEIIAGAEWRRDHARYDVAPPADLAGSHSRSINAAFAELRLPIVAPAAGLPALHELAIVLAGRVDDYSDIGAQFNPQYALIWRPVASLTLHSSFAESFRPPSLFDLYMPSIEITVPTADAARNDELALPIWRGGGNRDLRASTARSLTTSVVFEPGWSNKLRLAAAYWHIEMNEPIDVPSAARLLAAEDRVGGRIVRGEPSAEDLAAGISGPLQLIDVTRLNYGSIRTSGVDFSAGLEFDTDWGRFRPNLVATWVHDFATSDLVDGPDVSRVGVANLQGTVARWRAVAGLDWSRQGIGLATTLRYVPSYDDVDILGQRTGHGVASQPIVDVQFFLDLTGRFGDAWTWRGFEIRAGVLNVFDEEPPFAQVGSLLGYDPSQGDLRQRFGYIKLTKKF